MLDIILIEDDDSVRSLLKRALVSYGYCVREASNGKEGIALFNEKAADLIITDIIMPEKEGLEIIAEFRKSHPDFKIIAISGGGQIDSEIYLRMAKNLGAFQILSKPFETKELFRIISELAPADKPSDL